MVLGVGRRADLAVIGEAMQQAGLVAHGDIDDADEADAGVLAARIRAALEQREIDELGRIDRQSLENGPLQGFGG